MSEIQPSLGELEDAQNTAYENFLQRGMLLRRLGKELLPPMKRYVWQRKSI